MAGSGDESYADGRPRIGRGNVDRGADPPSIVQVWSPMNKVRAKETPEAAGAGGLSGAASGGALLVLTTCGSASAARDVAAALVERRLAACVNAVNGIFSTYRWQGRIVQEEECLLLIKTTAEQYAAV